MSVHAKVEKDVYKRQREDLNDSATRTMAVLHPLRLTVTNYPEGQTEIFEVENHPNHPEMGKREIPFSRDLWIEQDDFMEEKVGKFFRLFPGNEVRLKGDVYKRQSSPSMAQ